MSCSFGKQLQMLCIRSNHKHQKSLMLLISIMSLGNILLGFLMLGPEGLPTIFVSPWSLSVDTPFKSHNSTSNTSLSVDTPFKSQNSTSNTFPACKKEMQTPAESEHLRPMDVSKTQFKRVLEAEHVVAYIVREMDKMGAPVSFMFGSVLHEYRNGTGNCVEYNMRDKDFDIIVLPEDFPKLFGLIDDIKAKFGWKVLLRDDKSLFLMFAPHDLVRHSTGFQIDIYSFHRDHPKEGLLHFPWDGVTFEMDHFFPLVKYKSIASPDFGVTMNETANELARSNSIRTSDADSPVPPVSVHYHMPANVPCLLAKMYGDDFMTPKPGPGNQGMGTKKNLFRQSRWCKKIGTEDDDKNHTKAI